MRTEVYQRRYQDSIFIGYATTRRENSSVCWLALSLCENRVRTLAKYFDKILSKYLASVRNVLLVDTTAMCGTVAARLPCISCTSAAPCIPSISHVYHM